ncbi:hypothetical protein [Paenibacillus sp. y28]|uniref:hypothetical protein n=1 Tax=Paenibacillus sp. y28 TaxID=3129110 RepID=UPI003018CA64
MAIAVLTAVMTNLQVRAGSEISENVTNTSVAATSTASTLTAGFLQSGIDRASAQGLALSPISGLVQKEACVRAIADTFMISSLPLFLCIPFIFLFIQRRKKEPIPQPGPAASVKANPAPQSGGVLQIPTAPRPVGAATSGSPS